MRIRSGYSNELPSKYQEVEYIASSGTQYINTGYVAKVNNVNLELDMAWTGSNIGAFESFMGFMYSTSTVNPRMGLHKYSSVLMFGANSTTTSGTAPVKNERFVYKGDFTSGAQKLYKNGTQIATNSTTYDFSTNTCPVYIFARYCPNSMNYSTMRLYRAKIYEGTTLKMDFIPCYRKSDNVIGLYDKVTKEFYSNSGTDTFTKGKNIYSSFTPCITLLPAAYQQVEYLAGVNGNQYINTAYIPSYTKGFNIEFGFNPTVSGRRYCLLSNYNTGNQQLSLELAADNKVRLWMNNGSNDKKMTQTFTVNAYNKINYIYKSGTWTMIMTNGSGTYTDTGSYSVTGASTTTMRMFVDNATRTTTFNTPLKIYYCKIYEEDILIHYYVPCYRKSDTAIGIYDVVTKSFLTNNGSGTFTKGNNNVTLIKCQIPGFIYGYNQLFYPTTSGNWVGNAASATFSNGIVTATSTSNVNYWGIQHVSNKSASFYKNHKYYFSAECYPDTVKGNGSNTGLNLYSTNSGYVYQQSQAIPEKTWTRIESIFTVGKDSSGTIYPWIFTNQRSDRTVGDKVSIKNAILIDLTEWYGAGNEPTSTSIFSNTFPNSFYPTQQTTINLSIDEINKL